MINSSKAAENKIFLNLLKLHPFIQERLELHIKFIAHARLNGSSIGII